MALLIKNVSEILTMHKKFSVVKNGSILIEKGKIKKIGHFEISSRRIKTINAKGMIVCPGFVDSHTHLVFAGSREDEFSMRIAGLKYEKIARAGGGIAYTVKMTRAASEEQLYRLGLKRLKNITRHGTTTVEIKSGYGLSPREEVKMLRVIKKLQGHSVLDIVPTLLIHSVPQDMKQRDYVDLVTEELIPEVAEKKLAVFCDVFCDKLAFTRKNSERILKKAQVCNLKLKIHADQFSNKGGARLAAKMAAISADHLEYTTGSEIKLLKKAGVMPTLLPGVTFFLQMKKKPDIKAYLKHKIPFALASDFNPGSCMIYAMPKIISLACLIYKLPVEQAMLGATIYGAKALSLDRCIGSIEIDKQADLVILSVDNYKKLPYYFGEDIVKYTIKKGRIIYGEDR